MAHLRYLTKCIVVASAFSFQPAVAYDIVPTDSEWQSWPGYCQAKHVWTPVGESSKFKNAVGPRQLAELNSWEDAGIQAVHHYCAGLLWIQRAKVEPSVDQKAWMYDQAWSEVMFTANRSDRSSQLFTTLSLAQAQILYGRGDLEEAIRVLKDRIREDPAGDVLYSATAVMQRKLGQLEQAKSTLLQGNEATSGQSAEINYNLGLVSLELDHIEDAKLYAENAYRLGYPLPGLRTKLARLNLR